jgi:hypothetical protein
MATDILSITSDSKKLDEIASTVQVHCRRVLSLAEAIDNAIDFCAGEHAEQLGHALDYLNLLREAAEEARAAGEQLETLAIHMQGGGQ